MGSSTGRDTRVHVVHVVYAFAIGGLENVLVQLLNKLPADRYRHTVVALTKVTDFRQRVTVPGVEFVALDKPPGHGYKLWGRVWRLLRALKPDVLHTLNVSPLEMQPAGWAAGVPLRIHVEHGWDVHDRDGSNPKFRLLRRLMFPFVSHVVAVSEDLDRYLDRAIRLPARRRSLIANGVDLQRFAPIDPRSPRRAGVDWPADLPFEPGKHWLIGTVGRMQAVKNQPLLARAFVRLLREEPKLAASARLVLIGDGELRPEVERILDEAGVRDRAWIPGARSDIDRLMPWLDCFVLPSQTEGTSCTLQEAMACGLPAVVTAVGGNPELVRPGRNGWLVPSEDEGAMAAALAAALRDREATRALGRTARSVAERSFSLDGMVEAYDRLFSARR